MVEKICDILFALTQLPPQLIGSLQDGSHIHIVRPLSLVPGESVHNELSILICLGLSRNIGTNHLLLFHLTQKRLKTE